MDNEVIYLTNELAEEAYKTEVFSFGVSCPAKIMKSDNSKLIKMPFFKWMEFYKIKIL